MIALIHQAYNISDIHKNICKNVKYLVTIQYLRCKRYNLEYKYWGKMRRTKAYRLIFVGVASVLLGGCSGSSKANMEEAAEQPAVVDYTCISNPESDKQIYVILKNYHGAYWEKVIDGITEAAKTG